MIEAIWKVYNMYIIWKVLCYCFAFCNGRILLQNSVKYWWLRLLPRSSIHLHWLEFVCVWAFFFDAVFQLDGDRLDTENMNPEDLYNSIKKTSADIQSLSRLDPQFSDSHRDSKSFEEDIGFDRKRHYNPSNYQDEVLPLYSSLFK